MKNMRDCRFLLTCTHTKAAYVEGVGMRRGSASGLHKVSQTGMSLAEQEWHGDKQKLHHHTSAYSTLTGPSERPVVTDSADEETLLDATATRHLA